jgi:lactoylglutathione lyase
MLPTTLSPGDYLVGDRLTPQCASTAGTRLNHTMLRITNPEQSLSFYRDIFGMTLIFSFNTGPFVVYYLGHSSPGDTVPLDMVKSLGSRMGLLELMHVLDEDGNKTVLNNEQGVVGFGHLGFNVLDVEATLHKADGSGWKVLKWPSNVSVRTLAMPAYVEEGAFHEKFVAMYSQIGMLQDPDG